MKKIFTLIAGALMCASASAATSYQIVGGYNNWSLDTAIDLEAQSNGTFVGTVPELTSGFKIVGDRDWHPQYGMVSKEDRLVLDTPLTLGVAETSETPDFANIEFGDNIISISNAVVTFNPANKTVMVSGQAKKGYLDLYVSGSFCAWAAPGEGVAPKMDRDEDVYYCEVTLSGAGELKLFGAGWAPEFGFMSEDDVLTVTEDNPTVTIKRGGSVNVPYNIVGLCEIDFNYTSGELTITKLEDIDPDDIDLYVSGSFCGWTTPGQEGSVAMTRDGNIYTCTFDVEGEGEFKVFGEGWAPEFGFENAESAVTVTKDTKQITLLRNCSTNVAYSFDGAVSLSLTFDIKTGVLDIVVGEAGVAEVAADAAEAVYYNLQGIRVNETKAGQVYIKVAGEKATKVIR